MALTTLQQVIATGGTYVVARTENDVILRVVGANKSHVVSGSLMSYLSELQQRSANPLQRQVITYDVSIISL